MHLRIKISRKLWDTQKNQPAGKAGQNAQMVSDKPEADQNMNMLAAGKSVNGIRLFRERDVAPW